MTIAGRVPLRRALSLILAPLAIGLLASPSLARQGRGKSKRTSNAEVVGACISNYKSGLEQERTGRLLEARELFIRCAKTACGSPLREECTTRFTQLSIDIPSVVPVVTNAAGKPETNIEVAVDGQRLTSSLDGHSFILDPGAHDFSFSKDGHIFATQSLMIVQGQRNRLLSVSLQPSAPASDKHAQRQKVAEAPKAVPAAAMVAQVIDSATGNKTTEAPAIDLGARKVGEDKPAEGEDAPLKSESQPKTNGIPRLSFILAGAGLATVGAGALFTVWGRSDTDKLNICSPHCPQSSADHIHSLYLAADVSFGVGIASLAASYWAYAHFRSTRERSEGREEEVAARAMTPTFLVSPTPSGAVGTLAGSF